MRILFGLMLTGLCLMPSPRLQARGHALIVAVRDYPQSTDLSSLVGTNRHAERIQRVLLDGGYANEDVHLVYDDAPQSDHRPSRASILTQLDRLVRDCQKQDTLLVVITGHGVSHNGQSYFCPADATDEAIRVPSVAASQLLPVRQIAERLSQAPSRRKLLVMDACRKPADTERTHFVETLEKPHESVWLMNSCSANQYSWASSHLEQGVEHAVFSFFLCEGLAGAADQLGNNDGAVSLFELYSYTYTKTLHEVARIDEVQTPELFGVMAAPFAVTQTTTTRRSQPIHGDPQTERRLLADLLANHGLQIVQRANQQFQREFQAAVQQNRVPDAELYRDHHRQVCFALGTYLAQAVELDPNSRPGRRGRAWCFRSAGMYREALEELKHVDEPLHLFVRGSSQSLQQYLAANTAQANAANAAQTNAARPKLAEVVLYKLPGEPEIAGRLQAHSQVQVSDVATDAENRTWLLATTADGNPLPQPGWLLASQLHWFAEAADVYAPASPRIQQSGSGRPAVALRMQEAAGTLNAVANRLNAVQQNLNRFRIPAGGRIGAAQNVLRRIGRQLGNPGNPVPVIREDAGDWSGLANHYIQALKYADRERELIRAKVLEPVFPRELQVSQHLLETLDAAAKP